MLIYAVWVRKKIKVFDTCWGR